MEPDFQKFPNVFDDGPEEEQNNADKPSEVLQNNVNDGITNQLKKYHIYNKKDYWSRLNPSFRTVQGVLKNAQLAVAAIIALIVLITPEMREFIVLKPWNGKLIVFLTEFGTWAFLTYILGIKRIPVNYFNLVITRIFLTTDTIIKGNLHGESHGTRMRKKAAKAIGHVPDKLFGQMNFRYILVTGVFLALSFVITRATKIQVGKLDSLALIGSFASSTLGTFVLISSLSIDRFGIENHLILCKVWAYLTVLVSFFLALFIIQRAFQFQSRIDHWRPLTSFRMYFEAMICYMQIYIVIRHIPVIHSGFSFKENMSKEIPFIIASVIPKNVQPVFYEIIPALFFTVSNIMYKYHMAFPTVLMETVREESR